MALTEAEMIARNPSAWAKACDMVARIHRGEKILGYNLMACEAHPGNRECGRTIELVNWDIDGADHVQPEGFKCECGAWTSNECGDRRTHVCRDCEAA